MNLQELIASYRLQASDRVEPYFVGDDEVRDFLNEAQREAAIRRRLIHESANTNVCRIEVEKGVKVYQLHPALYELSYIAYRGGPGYPPMELRLSSTEWLDQYVCDWRHRVGCPEYAIQDDTTIRLVPEPNADGELLLEGYRLPLAPMVEDEDEPEIHEAHHAMLVQWVMYRAFSIPDTEFMDAQRAGHALTQFERYFGLRPSADLRRSTREDVPHVTRAFLP